MAVNTPSYAVVAIAAQDDYVWQLSSEKVPHLTLLFLGDQLNNVSKVEDYISHVVDTSLTKFGLEVDHRGVLGDKSADVLFFGDYGIDRLKDFQSYLLDDIDIFTAYNSTDQHPEWVPHLTMGYPEAPAKPDTRDYPGIFWVNFDRIALWTGDSEGVEFPLKTNNAPDLAMSAARGEAFVQHFGVKGMHWGVRRNRTSSANSNHSEDAKRVAESKKKLKAAKTTNVLTTRELQDLVNRMNLEQQYSRLSATEPSRFSKGAKFVKNAISAGRTINDVLTLVNSPAGKIIKDQLVAKK